MNSILYYCTILLYLFFSFIVINKIIKYFSTLFSSYFIYYLQLSILSSSHQKDQKKRRNPKTKQKISFLSSFNRLLAHCTFMRGLCCCCCKTRPNPVYQAYANKRSLRMVSTPDTFRVIQYVSQPIIKAPNTTV